MLDNKTVLVSGVGPGLGREVAAAALRDGANVAIGARKEARLREIAAALDPSGRRVAWRATDIDDPESSAALVAVAVERFGGLDAVVQVAAYETVASTLEKTKPEDWQRSFHTNVVATLGLVRAAAPALRNRGGGSVVLIGSQAMWLPALPQLAYGASKGALLAAMHYLVRELGPHKIRVNMVVPTWMWGPPVQAYVRWQAEKRVISEDEVVAEIAARMPLGEIPTDGDVAEAVVFFCSDRARMISGQALLVNAGEFSH